MTQQERNCARRLVVFTRYPEPGKTKRRLSPALGQAGAAELQRRMTTKVLSAARRLTQQDHAARLEVRYEGGDEISMRMAFGDGCVYVPQGAGHLGQRMLRAFEAAFADGVNSLVLIGSDCPSVTKEILTEAFRLLDARHDLVLGPAADGGYYLIGLRRPIADLFSARMPWGEADVRRRTLSIADALGLSVALLPELSDVDRPEDLADLAGTDLWKGLFAGISVIIPALNEEQRVAAAIESARQAPGAEVIVVDGGSADRTMETARSAGARVLVSARSRARQMNTGAHFATGDTLLFLHADSRLPENYPALVHDALAGPSVSAGAFEFKLDGAGLGLRLVERTVNLRSRRLGMPYGDQAIFLRAETFRDIGGFPDLPVMEDVEIVRRLRKRGRIRIVPAPVVTSARRWSRHGLVKTTLVNLASTVAYFLGVSPERLAHWRS